ncbi:MAG TPA: ParB/RepB/Spo0J family partition protein, partial [Gammaproteobacteria bacterium]|nr:ParB/RepB/Spo0J family partition protein [Gammaproteobacteria bacterium]
MATKRRGLGRGLNELLGHAAQEGGHDPAAAPDARLKDLGIDQLQPGKYQPRIDMHAESLEDLADSIRQQGVVQPIVVRPVAQHRYEIIAGERRWRAAQMAGLTEVPTVIRDVPDQAAIAMALIENIQRENLNPLEEANALKRLIKEFKLTHEQAAQAVGRSRASVSNLLRLLELEPAVRKLVEEGQLEMGHARALLALSDAKQVEVGRKIAQAQLSVREAEKLIRQMQQNKPAPAAKPQQSADIRRFQNDLSERLAAKVAIQHSKGGSGKLVIS